MKPLPSSLRPLRLSLGCALLLGAAAALASEPPAPKSDKTAKAAKAGKAAPVEAAPETAAAASDDPIEHLRLRLAERLAATKASTSGGPYDVRVSSRSGLPADRAARPAARSAGHGGAAAKGADGHAGAAAHWDYKGNVGPASWGALKPEFSLCGSGQRQSPIDIRGGLAVDLEPVRFDYKDSKFGVLDNGHTVQVNLAPGNGIDVGGRRFELQQFHFHRPSEERIDGRQFEMSLHLVHKDDKGRLAVVALLFDKGPAHHDPLHAFAARRRGQ
jgi:carbonic anhydrase